jgi:hypothetical protein
MPPKKQSQSKIKETIKSDEFAGLKPARILGVFAGLKPARIPGVFDKDKFKIYFD